jgi:hypothetical protein
MSYTVTGVLSVKNSTEQVTDKFRKREFVINDGDDKYPQEISFQLTQDSVALLDGYSVGDEVTVKFNIRGRKWTNPKTSEDRYFNTLEAWAISSNKEPSSGASTSSREEAFESESGDSGLPF